MTISKQNTIIESLQTTLKSIKTSNDFQLTVKKVYRGVRGLSDFSSANLPGLAVFRRANEVDKKSYDGTEQKLSINIWGYTRVEAKRNDYSNLDKLVADVEQILRDPDYNSYYEDTIIDTTTFFEGGVQDSFGFFNMQIELDYLQDLGDV